MKNLENLFSFEVFVFISRQTFRKINYTIFYSFYQREVVHCAPTPHHLWKMKIELIVNLISSLFFKWWFHLQRQLLISSFFFTVFTTKQKFQEIFMFVMHFFFWIVKNARTINSLLYLTIHFNNSNYFTRFILTIDVQNSFLKDWVNTFLFF